ncbi:MAG: hypothetical protein ACPGU1_07085 [Myxococcota bacterium]
MSDVGPGEARIRAYAAAIDAELSLTAEGRAWSTWSAEAAVGRNAHEAGRDQPWPVVHFDDVSSIPFLQEISGVEFYQLRARLRAVDGDLFAATCAAVDGYEPYNRDLLQLGSPEFVYAEAVETASEIALACQHGEAFERLREAARCAGGLTLHPYMGSTPGWELAKALSGASGVPVRCVAPQPGVTDYTNHKGHVVRAASALLDDGVLGGAPVVETRSARTPEGLVEALCDLALRHKKVALKMTRCASAMGNGLFEGGRILREERGSLLRTVQEFLQAKEWIPGEEVLAMSWEDAWSSPSTQLWIPAPSVGAPVVEGVYEQLLVGAEQVFLGSIPSSLGEVWDRRLTEASVRIGRLYQHLGYRGRCSFDFIIAGESAYLVECNGRWGGTSSPMHLVERVFHGARPAYRARDVVSERLVGIPFNEVLRRLDGHLFDARTGEGEFLLYNVGCLAQHGKLDVVAFGDDQASVTIALEERLPELLGIG